MGKFDGYLFTCDFDGTLASSPEDDHYLIEVSPENQAAIRYFTEEGGVFIVASGRAHSTFQDYVNLVPFNGPCMFANGAEIYDFKQQRVIQDFTIQNPAQVRTHLAALLEAVPNLALEFYCRDDYLYVVHPNEVSHSHLSRLQVNYDIGELDGVPDGWFKVLIEQENKYLVQAKEFITARWSDLYECIFSRDVLLELNGKGTSKGTSALWIADYLGLDREKLCCMGDNENDLSMLRVAAYAFAPENAVPAVAAMQGVHMMPHHNHSAVAAAISKLEALIS